MERYDTPYEPPKASRRKRTKLLEDVETLSPIESNLRNQQPVQVIPQFNQFSNPNLTYANPTFNPFYPNTSNFNYGSAPINMNQTAFPNVPYFNPGFQPMNPFIYAYPSNNQSFTTAIPQDKTANPNHSQNTNNSTVIATDKGNLNITINRESKFEEVPKLTNLTDLNWANRMWEYLNVKYNVDKWNDADLKKAIFKGLNNHNTPVTSSGFPSWYSYFMAVLSCIGQKLGVNDNLQVLKNVKQKKEETVSNFNARFTEALYNCGTYVPGNIACDYY